MRRRFKALFLVPALLLIALAAWAVSSPIGSSPDDDFHLTSVWCATGDRPGLCESTGDSETRSVAREIASAPTCYAFKPAESGVCQETTAAGGMTETTRGNFNGGYPPVFYGFMSLFAGADVATSAMVMRLVNVVLFVATTTVLFWLLPVPRRATLLWSWTIGLIPLTTFLLASNNPSSWAIISAGTVWLSFVGYAESAGWRRVALGVLGVVAAILGAGARTDAAVYGAIGAIVAIVLTLRRDRRALLGAILPAAVVLIMIAGFLFTGRQSGVVTGGFGDHDLPPGFTTGTLALDNLVRVPELWLGTFGTWSLGWLDTPLPGIVTVGSAFVFAGMMFVGIASSSLRKWLALALVIGAAWTLPAWILLQSKVPVGYEVQPRYILPLVVMAGGVALLVVGAKHLRLSTPQLVILAVAVSVSNAVALHVNLRRYLTGLDNHDWNLDRGIEWWWQSPVSPMTVWAIGTLAFGAAIVIAVLEARRLGAVEAARDAEPSTAAPVSA